MADFSTAMVARAKSEAVLTEEELNTILCSIKNINPNIDVNALKPVLSEVAHLSHKNWSRTGLNSERLGAILMPSGMGDAATRQMLARIVNEGNWEAAEKHGGQSGNHWAVLVTGK